VSLRKALPTIETTAIWLFLLQALRVLFASLFGVIYQAIFDASLSPFIVVLDMLLVILAMFTPLLLRRFRGQVKFRVGAALLVVAARIPLSLTSPTVRLYASILLLGGAAFYVAHLLWREPERLVTGLLIGLGADQLLRALDYTYDPTLRPGGLPFVIVAAFILGLLSLYLAREESPTPSTQPHIATGLALGAALFLETALLALPNALAHWSGVGYYLTAPLLLLFTLLPLIQARRPAEMYLSILLWPMDGPISVILVFLCLLLAALLGGVLAFILLLGAQLLLLINLTQGIVKKRVPPEKGRRLPGWETSLGLLLFLLFHLAFAFTFTYPYTLPFLRGLGTPILLAAAPLATLSILNIFIEPEVNELQVNASAISAGSAVVLSVICALFTLPATLPDAPAAQDLRLATFNIHYGFDSDWAFNLEGIAEAIESEGVDVIVLQEVDAGRITSMSVDDALWLGQRLDMRVVYQPTLEALSGIALLSRYPLVAQDGQWLTSALEQTAIVHGAVETQGRPLSVYGVWLGLEPEERATQLSEALDYIGAKNPVALGGDFNATPDSPIYARLIETNWKDPFTMTGTQPPPTFPSTDPAERIDYVWLRGITATQTWVSDATASDHRMVVVEAQLNP